MSAEKQAVGEFLHRVGMHYEDIDVASVVDSFIDEMTKGLNGETSSLAMIPTFIEADRPIPRGRKVMVLDAGGTNLRRALVSFGDDGLPVIEEFRKSPMPGSKGPISKDEFFRTLAGEIRDLTDRADRLGFCFSYPTEIFPDRDGRLIHFTKEVKAPEVEGQVIGTNLKKALADMGAEVEPEVVVLNDTVATLLTGKASHPGKEFDGYVGFILGTGTNCCYLESNAAIGKVTGLDADHFQVINVESGGFSRHPRGRGDENLDKASQVPGTFFLEKMVSGGYFGQITYETIRLARAEGLFSEEGGRSLDALEGLSTKDADNYLHNPGGRDNALVVALESGTEEDRVKMYHLIDALLERAARLTAANMSAAVVKSGRGKNPLKPVCLTVDGTTYYLFNRFRFRVEKYLDEYLGSRGYWYESVKVEDAPLIGAAIAGLTN